MIKSTTKKNPEGFPLQGEFDFKDLHIMVENKKGSVRSGVDPDGNKWSIKMQYPYGYISRTKAADKEHVDCYVGDDRDSDTVFVVRQVDPKTGKYDEDKVMLGFKSADQAKKAYLAHYDSPKFFGSMIEMSYTRFKESLKENKGKMLQKAIDLQQAVDIIEKGGKGLPIGTIKTHADGVTRIKTAKGWRPHNAKTQVKVAAQVDNVNKVLSISKQYPDANIRLEKLIEGGVHDVETLVDSTKLDRSNILAKMESKGIVPTKQTFDNEVIQKRLDKPPVKERWKAYELYLNMVAGGLTKSAIAYGTGGVGKTYTMKKILESKNMTEYNQDEHITGSPDYDFVKITGKSTPTAMYKALYEHNGKVVVFDDCDSVLKDETSINILKGALDTTGDGTVSYLSGKPIKDADGEPLPQRFDFVGRAIFISNLTPSEMPQPLRSRALTIDLTMTAGETVEMLKTIAHKMPFQDNMGNPIEVSTEDRQAAVDYIDSVKDKVDVGDLNARTLAQIALVRKQVRESGVDVNWKTMAAAMLS